MSKIMPIVFIIIGDKIINEFRIFNIKKFCYIRKCLFFQDINLLSSSCSSIVSALNKASGKPTHNVLFNNFARSTKLGNAFSFHTCLKISRN
jgi:hypothetical protein